MKSDAWRTFLVIYYSQLLNAMKTDISAILIAYLSFRYISSYAIFTFLFLSTFTAIACFTVLLFY